MIPGIAAVYVSGTSFTVAGDLTADFAAGVRVLADCGVDGTPLGTVTAATYSAPNTTVTVALDSGSLTANLTHVWHGNDIPASLCNHASQHMLGGRDAITPEDIGGMPADREIATTAPLWGGGTLWDDLTLGIDAADTDGPGVVELATDAEGVAGTDASRVPPVATLRQAYRSWQRDDAGRFPGLILPAYNLFAPNLALPGTTTFTRASSGWVLGAAGIVKAYSTNAPRFDYDASGNLLGLRIEGAATRLNTIAAAPTAPENVSVSAVAYTLSFFGTGSMTLSGAHAATVNGAGALPARVSYTFTPTAGTLVLTPSGDVQHLQVEAGSFASSPILGEGSAVARAADVCSLPLSGIDFNAAEGSLFADITMPTHANTGYLAMATIDASNLLYLRQTTSRTMQFNVTLSGGNQCNIFSSVFSANERVRVGISWKANAFFLATNGAVVSDFAGSVPSGLGGATLFIGQATAGTTPWNSTIRHLAYFPRALTAEQLQAMTL